MPDQGMMRQASGETTVANWPVRKFKISDPLNLRLKTLENGFMTVVLQPFPNQLIDLIINPDWQTNLEV